MSAWRWRLHGGAFDGVSEEFPPGYGEAPRVLVAWKCSDEPHCTGHVTDDPRDEDIDLTTAEAYRRGDSDVEQRVVAYEVGQDRPSRERYEVVENFGRAGGVPVA